MKKILIAFTCCCAVISVQAQDMLSGLEQSSKDYTIATFKGTRLINFHTTETLSKGSLEVRIAHRFGAFSTGANNLWGLDGPGPASVQLRVDYAPTDRFMLGVGRSSDQKIVDGFVKYRWLRQTTDGSMPLSITGLASVNVAMVPNRLVNDRYSLVSSRLSYMYSLLIARKFNSKFSAQLSPIYIHNNITDHLTDKNDILSVAGSVRYKFSKRIAFTVEYLSRVTPYTADKTLYHDIIGAGFDIETGGHVFQVIVTNGLSINEPRMIAYTTGGLWKGLMLGFNISRVFSVKTK